MQVNTIRVSFLREKQPAQYEKAQPFVEFAAALDDDEDYLAAARQLMLDAATVVYAGIGYAVPDKVAAQLNSDSATEIVVDGGEIEVNVEEELDKEKPKKRGRPKGSKNTQPKADSKAATKLNEKVAAASKTGRNISENPEDRVNPADDIPDDEPEKKDVQMEDAPVYTGDNFHKDLTDAVKDGEITGPHARQILAPYKAARARDLTPEQAVGAKKALDQLIGSN